ncbi:MAG TPA: BrxA/BrxB family bacilliredoxin [Edaphocola sp.]|nr:BrxA/BrxB family bacilliredoxin [Edaphocola sp.]
MYPAELVKPMKDQMTSNGFKELLTVDQVNEELTKEGTTLLFINSVCGCAAGTARPGVIASIQGDGVKPDNLVTSFAGFDYEGVQEARKHLVPYPPSSPAIALLKNGQLVHIVERHRIEGRTVEMVAADLKQAYEMYCN